MAYAGQIGCKNTYSFPCTCAGTCYSEGWLSEKVLSENSLHKWQETIASFSYPMLVNRTALPVYQADSQSPY
jgi:hypothetical protein